MRKRIITAAVLVPLLLLVLFVAPKVVTAVLFSLLCAIAAYEMLFNTGFVRHPRLVIYSMVAAAMVPLWSFFGTDAAWALAGILFFVTVLFMEVMLSDLKLRFEKISICFVAGILLPYMLSALVRIIARHDGRYLILIPFVIAFLSDSGAYFIGCRYGKHKLAPVISPNKSIEGVAGGVTTAVVGMLIYLLVMQLGFGCRVNYLYALLYAILGSFMGVFGDLCFSSIKRQTGIKDFGNIIPGHGGVLDRFDSMLLIAPLTELLLMILPAVVK